ncbi:hypothetical protein GCK32_005672 [Trichostrongylus colubriformis]|uniref:Uncharacterized protein n=1 Tax=Trichostrongylus colubriformis TaxID=6319 RepID=A0AAN8IZW6_TRICO
MLASSPTHSRTMSLLSGIAKFLNPFSWLHRNTKTRHSPSHEYELQEDDMEQTDDEAPFPLSFSESNVENVLDETCDMQKSYEHDDDLNQMCGDASLDTEEPLDENTLEANDVKNQRDTEETDNAEVIAFARTKFSLPKPVMHSGTHPNNSTADTSRNGPSFNEDLQFEKDKVAPTQQVIGVDGPTPSENELWFAEGMIVEPVVEQDMATERNGTHEKESDNLSKAPTTTDGHTNDGTITDEYGGISSHGGAVRIEDTVVILDRPNIVGIFGKPTVGEIKSAKKRRAQDDSHDSLGIATEYASAANQQVLRVKYPRRSYNAPSVRNTHPTGARESPSSPVTPANTPTSFKTRSRSDRSGSV